MSEIEIGPNMIQVDAELVAKALGMTPRQLQQRMREGTVTSRSERGEGEDAGRVRVTFFSATRRARITADINGTILSCSAMEYAVPPKSLLPAADSARTTPQTEAHRRLDAQLDAALQATFPASDPVALYIDYRD